MADEQQSPVFAKRVAPSVFGIRHSPSGIRHSAFGIRHSAFGISHNPSAINHCKSKDIDSGKPS